MLHYSLAALHTIIKSEQTHSVTSGVPLKKIPVSAPVFCTIQLYFNHILLGNVSKICDSSAPLDCKYTEIGYQDFPTSKKLHKVLAHVIKSNHVECDKS